MYGCLLMTVPVPDPEGVISLEGRRFYSPTVVVAYMLLLGLPMALILYGLNLWRWGDRKFGIVLCLMAVSVLGLRLIGSVSTELDITDLGHVFLAYGLFQLASGPYVKARERGALPARWWPPLAIFTAVVLGLGVARVLIAETLYSP